MFKRDTITALLKVAVSTIAFEDLSRYLPFQTRVVSGNVFNHIQSATAFDITTYGKPSRYGMDEYTVSEGDTLCRRGGAVLNRGVMKRDCPGCLAIAQGIIKRDIEKA